MQKIIILSFSGEPQQYFYRILLSFSIVLKHHSILFFSFIFILRLKVLDQP